MSSSESVPILCHYDGTLSIDCYGRPLYNGGKIKTFRISKKSKFAVLRKKIYSMTGINPNEFQIRVVCKSPTESGEYVAMEVTDDDGTRNMLSLYPTVKILSVLVVTEPIVPAEIPSAPQEAGFGSVDYMGTESYGFMSTQTSEYEPTSVYSQYPLYESSYSGWNVYPSSSTYSTASNEMEIPPSSYLNTENFGSTVAEVPTSHVSTTFTEAGPSTVREQSDSDDSDDQLEDPMVENSMQFVYDEEEDNQWVHEARANNDYREFEDPLPDEVIDEEAVRNYSVERLNFVERPDSTEDNTFTIGQTFATKSELHIAITEWSIRRAVAFKVVKSTPTSYTIVCANKTSSSAQCPWRLHASVPKGWRGSNKFTIKKFSSIHTCRNSGRDLESRQVTAKFICDIIMPVMRTRLDMTPAVIQDHIKFAYRRDISYYKAWDARRKALSKMFGDWKTSYSTLEQYMNAIETTNPGTVYKIISDPVDDEHATFNSLFWTFGPSIEGFKYCRPVLSIDGTHLYGKYRGCLLVATGVDANGGLFPLAYAVVSAETTQNWQWFFACMWEYIPYLRRRQICWISDRMKGIPTALTQAWPSPHFHRYCLRHIRANFKIIFKSESLQNLLYSAGQTPDTLMYTDLRKHIRERCPAADDWIESSLGPDVEDRWALCKDGGRRYCITTTNCSESFNGVLKGARALPIQSIVARTFYRSNHYFVTRREMGAQWDTEFSPSTETVLRDRVRDSRFCQLQRFSAVEWEVTDRKGYKYCVVIDDDEGICSCDCNIPLLQKIPCIHVIRACSRSDGGANEDFERYISQWYKTEYYHSTYSPTFHPIRDSRYWQPPQGPTLLPPVDKRKKGRPKSTRIKGAMDDQGREGERRQNRCSKCRVYGHNRARCPKNQ